MEELKAIEPEKDAVIVHLIDGDLFLNIECLNSENKDALFEIARKIHKGESIWK